MGLVKQRQSVNLLINLKVEGKTVVLAAGDTFRAGAIEQLEVWGESVGVDVLSKQKALILQRLCLMRFRLLNLEKQIFCL